MKMHKQVYNMEVKIPNGGYKYDHGDDECNCQEDEMMKKKVMTV